MEFLTENLTPVESNIIQESSRDGKSCFLSGIFLQSEICNRNGRVYPLEEMTKAINEASIVIKANQGIFGELDHPDSLTINLDRVSHAITELKMVGNDVIGKAKIIEKAPMGAIAKALLESGVRFGVSSRGTGQLNSDNRVSDFNFITADLVATPSAPGAMPETIYESLNLDKNGYRAITLAEQIKEDAKAQEFMKKEIKKFVSKVFGDR